MSLKPMKKLAEELESAFSQVVCAICGIDKLFTAIGRRMRTIPVFAVVGILTSTVSAAPLIDVDLGVGAWAPGISGHINASNNQEVDLDKDLGLEADKGLYLYAEVDHPIFFLPDFKVRYQSLVANGSGTVNVTTEYAGVTLNKDEKIDTKFDLSYTDFILNYELPVPSVDVDLGANFRWVDGKFTANDESGDVSIVLPMAHLAAELQLDSISLALGGEYNFLPLGDGSSVSDYNLYAKYYLPLPGSFIGRLGVELGYHDFSMDVGDEVFGADTAKYASNVTAKGIYMGLAASF